jgi:hypothetical protein
MILAINNFNRLVFVIQTQTDLREVGTGVLSMI